jgi:aryl-phospho-beta-D-glucosidase BglC (GH1 family)
VDKRNHMIHAHGLPTSVRGINWFGLEGEYLGLHGLWSGRSLESIVDQVHQIGFNSLRIPLAPESLAGKAPGKDGYSSPLEQLKKLLAYTNSKKKCMCF